MSAPRPRPQPKRWPVQIERDLARYRRTAIEIAGKALRLDPTIPDEVMMHLREAYKLYCVYAYRLQKASAVADSEGAQDRGHQDSSGLRENTAEGRG